MARREAHDLNGIPCVIETDGNLTLYHYDTPEAFDKCFELYCKGVISPIQQDIEDINQVFNSLTEPVDQSVANVSWEDLPSPEPVVLRLPEEEGGPLPSHDLQSPEPMVEEARTPQFTDVPGGTPIFSDLDLMGLTPLLDYDYDLNDLIDGLNPTP